MRRRDVHFWIWLSTFGALVLGCQASEEPAVAPQPRAAAATASRSDAVAEGNGGSTPTLAPGDDKPTPAAVAQFLPPFPDRLELFEPPKRAQGTVRHNDESGETVELKGFVNVDQPRVVLSIDGVISPIAEGGEKYGVQVISIQPPSVVLQRGRSRWTATLE